MSSDFQQGNQFNPYQSAPATFDSIQKPPFNTIKVQAPAIALIVCGGLSLLASIYGVVNAMISSPPPVPPNSPEWMEGVMKNSVGMTAAIIQSVFIFVALFVLFGGIQMLRLKSRGVAIAASIVTMLNIGSCCCIVGMPIGIWALVILMLTDVAQAFEV